MMTCSWCDLVAQGWVVFPSGEKYPHCGGPHANPEGNPEGSVWRPLLTFEDLKAQWPAGRRGSLVNKTERSKGRSAEELFQALDPDDHHLVQQGLEAWLASEQWNSDGGRFIPHMRTWLYQMRWRDAMEDAPQPLTHELTGKQRELLATWRRKVGPRHAYVCTHDPECPDQEACDWKRVQVLEAGS